MLVAGLPIVAISLLHQRPLDRSIFRHIAVEHAILQSNQQIRRVTTHLEAPESTVVARQDVTQQYPEMVARIHTIADEVAGAGSAHDIHLYRSYTPPSGGKQTGENEHLELVLHTISDTHAPISHVHLWAEEIQRTLRQPSLSCFGCDSYGAARAIKQHLFVLFPIPSIHSSYRRTNVSIFSFFSLDLSLTISSLIYCKTQPIQLIKHKV